MSSERRLTFGVEFEFIVPQATHASHPHDYRWYDRGEYDLDEEGAVCRVLVDCLKNVVPIVKDDERETLIHTANEREIILQPGDVVPFSHFWKTSVDGSLGPRPGEDVEGGYCYSQRLMEISSRILQEDEFNEVALVYRRLRASIRINLNSSCSFHVHVGTAHLDLIGYQKLTTLIMVCEQFLWRFCEVHRRDNPWCLEISSHSKTACLRIGQSSLSSFARSLLPSNIPRDLVDSLRGIWAATSVDELRRQIRVQYKGSLGEDFFFRGAFAIRGERLGSDIQGKPCASPTVEFRYSHASGDPERDNSFVRVCIALVRAAEFDLGTYKATVASFARGGDFSNFLTPLGLQDLYQYCTAAEGEYIRRGANSPGPPTEFLAEI